MKILGISAFYHDAAAVLIDDDKILAAAQEERFTRKKNDPAFPTNAIKFCLDSTNTKIDELYAVTFYDKPFLKFERLLETYYNFAPKGISSFLSSIPVWIKEKLFLKKTILDELLKIDTFNKKNLKLLFTDHHLSHAASAFFPSAFKNAAILTIDGVGEWATAAMYEGNGNEIRVIKELNFPHSLGLLYAAFTYYLGFKVNSGEYKMMGLAPYGNAESSETKDYVRSIKDSIVHIYDDGSIWLNQDFFNYAVGLTMANETKWEKLFGFPKRSAEATLEQRHCNLALAIQLVTEEIIIAMAKNLKKETGAKYLCLAGGVALNCVANGKLLETGLFEDIFIQPAAGDAGGALGAALATYHIYAGNKRDTDGADKMKGAYLGPEYTDAEIENTLKRYNAQYTKVKNFDELTDRVASLIDSGNVIGWFQGKLEFGPRALGNRSIIGDARNPDMQKKLNLKIKYRESFRPFAPSVLIEDVDKFFDSVVSSPYMLLITRVKDSKRNQLPKDYANLPLKEKLYFLRSDLPAITHLDFSARLQTVHKETNERYWNLINKFKEKTGYGIIVNTSFNVRGEPIVCSPDDAFRCFMRTEMDYLVLGDYILNKKEQTQISDSTFWKEKFETD